MKTVENKMVKITILDATYLRQEYIWNELAKFFVQTFHAELLTTHFPKRCADDQIKRYNYLFSHADPQPMPEDINWLSFVLNFSKKYVIWNAGIRLKLSEITEIMGVNPETNELFLEGCLTDDYIIQEGTYTDEATTTPANTKK